MYTEETINSRNLQRHLLLVYTITSRSRVIHYRKGHYHQRLSQQQWSRSCRPTHELMQCLRIKSVSVIWHEVLLWCLSKQTRTSWAERRSRTTDNTISDARYSGPWWLKSVELIDSRHFAETQAEAPWSLCAQFLSAEWLTIQIKIGLQHMLNVRTWR
jgi:hypothetical protein